MNNLPKITQMQGGDESWFYLFDESGKIVMASHKDNKKQMQCMEDELLWLRLMQNEGGK